MRALGSLAELALLAVFTAAPSAAQSLDGRHQIELRAGAWHQMAEVRTAVSSAGVSTTVEGSGLLAGVAYGHWLQEYLALTVSVGVRAASVDARSGIGGMATEVAVVTPLLVGVKYYFPKSTYARTVRPLAGAGLGAFAGAQTSTQVGASVTVAARTEVSPGGELTTGIDFVLGHRFILTGVAGFSLMTDFAEPIGGSDNYSGLYFALGLSFVFGAGAQER